MRSFTKLLFAAVVSSSTLAFAAEQLSRQRTPATGCCTLIVIGVMFWLLSRTGIPWWLSAGIAFFPLGFAWLTLREDYRAARTLAFAYLVIPICLVGSVGAIAGVMAARDTKHADAPSAGPTRLRETCAATGKFTLNECECLEREARTSRPAFDEDDVDRAWLTAATQKCAPSANADPLGPPAPETEFAVIPARVVSLPEGAEVLLDGRKTGKKTPAEVELTSGTKASIEVRLDGYLPQEREVKYRVGDPAVVTFNLDAAAALAVKTEPSGARVLLERTAIILHTPGEVRGLKPATVRVAIQREGHVTIMKDVTLEPGKTVTLEETLVPAAWVTVTSTPTEANVEIDGVVMAERTPTPVPVRANEKHTVVVSLPDRTPIKKVIKSGAVGTTTSFTATLVDAKLQALTRAQNAADKAQSKAERELDRAREKHDDAEARGTVTTKQVQALDRASEAFSRAEDRANEAAAALSDYREAQERAPRPASRP